VSFKEAFKEWSRLTEEYTKEFEKSDPLYWSHPYTPLIVSGILSNKGSIIGLEHTVEFTYEYEEK
jgi:hypothetical protein